MVIKSAQSWVFLITNHSIDRQKLLKKGNRKIINKASKTQFKSHKKNIMFGFKKKTKHKI